MGWVHLFVWPVTAIIVAVQARRAISAAAIAWWSKDIPPLDLSGLEGPVGMAPAPGDPDGGGE